MKKKLVQPHTTNNFAKIVTTQTKKENVLLAIQSGANNYIVKPFTAETLKEKMDKVWQQISGG